MKRVLLNVGSLLVGTVLLCHAFGWQAGLGIGLLVYFHKDPEQ